MNVKCKINALFLLECLMSRICHRAQDNVPAVCNVQCDFYVLCDDYTQPQ